MHTHMRPHTYTFLPTCVRSHSMQSWGNRNQCNTLRIIMIHWNENVIVTKFLSLAAPEILVQPVTKIFVKMMTFQFQCFAATVKLLSNDYLTETSQEMPDDESMSSRLNYEEHQPYFANISDVSENSFADTYTNHNCMLFCQWYIHHCSSYCESTSVYY